MRIKNKMRAFRGTRMGWRNSALIVFRLKSWQPSKLEIRHLQGSEGLLLAIYCTALKKYISQVWLSAPLSTAIGGHADGGTVGALHLLCSRPCSGLCSWLCSWDFENLQKPRESYTLGSHRQDRSCCLIPDRFPGFSYGSLIYQTSHFSSQWASQVSVSLKFWRRSRYAHDFRAL
jgi:hypothetical protein